MHTTEYSSTSAARKGLFSSLRQNHRLKVKWGRTTPHTNFVGSGFPLGSKLAALMKSSFPLSPLTRPIIFFDFLNRITRTLTHHLPHLIFCYVKGSIEYKL